MSGRERTLCAWCSAPPDGSDVPDAATNWGLCRDCLRGLLESVLEDAESPSPPPPLH